MPLAQSVLTVPVWYGPTAEQVGPSVAEVAHEYGHRHHRMHAFEAGVASFQGSSGLATLAGLSRPAGKASRTYTNADIDQLNQSNGTVKWDNKTEHID
jgi:hypothetical protein